MHNLKSDTSHRHSLSENYLIYTFIVSGFPSSANINIMTSIVILLILCVQSILKNNLLCICIL